MTSRRILFVLAAALPAVAIAYLMPVESILRRLGERRASLSLSTLEVTGTLSAEGPGADRITAATGASSSVDGTKAALLMKVPGHCRVELWGREGSAADRPFASFREGHPPTAGPLAEVPSVNALLSGVCSLLAVSPEGDASSAYAEVLGRRGVALSEVTLGRFEGRVAYVLGGRARDAKPLAFVDKDTFQPLRIEFKDGATNWDVRFLGWGSPNGGDWFPRSVEVYEDAALRLRWTTERAIANPRLPEARFP